MKSLAMMQHAIGMDNRSCFTKYGEKHFLSYRNYYGLGHENSDWEDWVKHGLANACRSKSGITYSLTCEGYNYLDNLLDIRIHTSFPDRISDPIINADNEADIKEIWKWLKKKEIYTEEFRDELDVAIYLSEYDLTDFLEHFTHVEHEIPARLFAGGVMVLFTDLLNFRASGKQIWNLRPQNGMRNEW